jgi:hypothetical protein
MKGKNFSCNNTGKRNLSDFYQTPYCLTDLLLKKEPVSGTILEPACGEGAIVARLPYCTAWYDKERDFFKETNKYDTIITNPPYSLAQEFILKAKEVATKKIIMLLPLSYLHGKKRYDVIYQDKEFALKKIYVFTRYPMLESTIRPDGKHKTGMMVYAWFVWEKGYTAPPQIDWLDNNEYVINKKEEKCLS